MHVNEQLHVNTQDYSLWLISIPSPLQVNACHNNNNNNNKNNKQCR